MPYPFSNALYYPSIDIDNTEWLRTAVLFWDSISTIVPEEIDNPYCTSDTEYLYMEGILRPLKVNSYDNSVISIEDDVLSVLSSPEVIEKLFCDYSVSGTRIYKSKMSVVLIELMEDIKRDKYQDKLERYYRRRYNNSTDSPLRYYSVDDVFALFYMTVLANKLSERDGLEMISDRGIGRTAA